MKNEFCGQRRIQKLRGCHKWKAPKGQSSYLRLVVDKGEFVDAAVKLRRAEVDRGLRESRGAEAHFPLLAVLPAGPGGGHAADQKNRKLITKSTLNMIYNL